MIGHLLATLARQGRLRWLTWLLILGVFAFVVPLVFPLLGAFYLNLGVFPEAMHKWYAAQIVRAYGVRDEVRESAQEVSSGSNRRLDYFQVIEFIDAAREQREYSISLVPQQRARFVLERATLRSGDMSCPIPPHLLKKNQELMQLRLFDHLLLSVKNSERPSTYELSAQDWNDVKSRMDETNRAMLTLTPVDALAALDCDGVKIDLRISVEVFKDFVQPAPT